VDRLDRRHHSGIEGSVRDRTRSSSRVSRSSDLERRRGLVPGDSTGTTMAEEEFNRGFNDWFASGVAAGQIPAAGDRLVYLTQYAAGQLETHARLLRETREMGIGYKQEKAQLLRENAAREDQLARRRDRFKEEERAVRELRDQGRQIATVDGSDLGLLRSWVEQVGRAGRVAGAKSVDVVKFALSHSKGNLHEVIYSVYEDNADSTWEEVRGRLVGLFLTAREATALVDIVFTLKQERGELMSAYCMRYSTAVQRAWPEKGLAKLGAVHNMVVKKFEDSLIEPIVRLAVRLSRSNSLEAAMAVARENEEGLAGPGGSLTGAHRMEEPMEVGAMEAYPKTNGTDLSVFKQIQGEIKSLRRLVADRTERTVHAAQLSIAPAAPAPSTVVVQTAPAQPPPISAVRYERERGGVPRKMAGRAHQRSPSSGKQLIVQDKDLIRCGYCAHSYHRDYANAHAERCARVGPAGGSRQAGPRRTAPVHSGN